MHADARRPCRFVDGDGGRFSFDKQAEAGVVVALVAGKRCQTRLDDDRGEGWPVGRLIARQDAEALVFEGANLVDRRVLTGVVELSGFVDLVCRRRSGA